MKKKMPPKPPGLNVGAQPKTGKSWYQPYWYRNGEQPNQKKPGSGNRKNKQ